MSVFNKTINVFKQRIILHLRILYNYEYSLMLAWGIGSRDCDLLTKLNFGCNPQTFLKLKNKSIFDKKNLPFFRTGFKTLFNLNSLSRIFKKYFVKVWVKVKIRNGENRICKILRQQMKTNFQISKVSSVKLSIRNNIF